ncbi:NUDIX domain-containing protein [Nioella sediminis]|jgi:8-oxo-dGTP diphosphatase|uniref:NUDIX domain-containing protein n=1 Tax=Nioella sediminis TaxID=1912092 RepID=UPI0008FCEA66|nr:NUDIX hydrolase [Nioella sediminis]TBX15134.1 NUDIX hydrolase [Roseovarius sp. JS7-11]
MNRRFGPQPDPARRYIPRRGVYAAILTGDGILATFQEKPLAELQLPGGGIDPGESPLAALHREVFEETGYRIHSPRRLGMFHRFTYMPDYDIWAQKLCTVYVARLGSRLADPTETHHTPVFLPWDEAETMLGVDGDRFFVSRLRSSLRA